MTKLNLHKEFAPLSADDLSWKLQVHTRSREELIHLAIFLAKTFKSEFFYDAGNPPIIEVPGWASAGKSMVVEAMMKTLLDQTDPLDMLKPDAPKTMFIEKRPMEARKDYTYAAGTHEGVSVLYSFDRLNQLQYELRDEFSRAIAEFSPKPAGGAIFWPYKGSHLKQRWLTINLEGDRPDLKWGRLSTITVHSPELKADPKFQLRWRHLQDIVKSGDFSRLAEPVHALPKRSYFQSLTDTLTQVLRR